jgi:uncharacterized membrane protein
LQYSKKCINFATKLQIFNLSLMKTPYEYRAHAREALRNQWGDAAITSLMILLITMAISTPSIITSLKGADWGGSITTLLAVLVLPLQYAFYISLLDRIRTNETKIVNYTITYARQHAYANMRFLIAGLLIMILSSLLAIITLGIGAIILSYAYGMVPYLLHDYPELTPREAMKISREMMRGQKWNLFVLDLTFIGWILLAFCTAGVGMLFVQPYMLAARAAFYNDLKSEKIIEDFNDPTAETIE